jgi:hypothetical protein
MRHRCSLFCAAPPCVGATPLVRSLNWPAQPHSQRKVCRMMCKSGTTLDWGTIRWSFCGLRFFSKCRGSWRSMTAGVFLQNLEFQKNVYDVLFCMRTYRLSSARKRTKTVAYIVTRDLFPATPASSSPGGSNTRKSIPARRIEWSWRMTPAATPVATAQRIARKISPVP